MTQRKLNNQYFSIPYITSDFVYSQLIHLYISKSTGSGQISAKFLKLAAPIIASHNSPVHSNQLKWYPYIKHVPNLTTPTTFNSLILERHVNLHLKAYLALNSLFYFRQPGFREHHSCQTALIKIIDDWLSLRKNSRFIIFRLF